MSKITEFFRKQEDLVHGPHAKKEDIMNAEKTLGLTFSKEYKQYLYIYGQVAFNSRELTGIGLVKHLDVVEKTIKLKSINKDIPDSMYVIEDIDDIVILQDSNGNIYQTQLQGKPTLIFPSLTDYLNN